MSLTILHPDRNKPLPLSKLCGYYKDGYYQVVTEEEKQQLKFFLKSFEEYYKTEALHVIKLEAYENLPFSINSSVWKQRQRDVNIILKHIGKREKLNILDIGSWNGWLSNYLTKLGHCVVATNIFTDDVNGLKAKKYYNNDYICLQIFAHEIRRIKQKFDVIVFNRNWPYIENNTEAFKQAIQLLNSGGVVILTGLPVYRDPSKIIQKRTVSDIEFREKYGISLYFHSGKGYLDYGDILNLKKTGIKIRSYSTIKTIYNIAFPEKARLFYGIFNL